MVSGFGPGRLIQVKGEGAPVGRLGRGPACAVLARVRPGLDPPGLDALCHMRDAERAFALSRIQGVMPT